MIFKRPLQCCTVAMNRDGNMRCSQHLRGCRLDKTNISLLLFLCYLFSSLPLSVVLQSLLHMPDSLQVLWVYLSVSSSFLFIFHFLSVFSRISLILLFCLLQCIYTSDKLSFYISLHSQAFKSP